MMHCPSCGANASADQKFCRACGLSLEKVPGLLAEQLQTAKSGQIEKGPGRPLWFEIENWGRLVVVIGLTVFIPLGLATGVYVLLRSGNTIGALGLIAVGAFLVFGALPLAWGEYLRKSSAGRPSRESETLEPTGSSTKALGESAMEPVPSVTEKTTELLELPTTPRK
jgi:hypothetical protein